MKVTLRCKLRALTYGALVSAVMGCSPLSDASKDLVNKPVPEGRLMLLSGEDIALRGRSGTNMALLFWATWCPHSRGAIADYEGLAQRYSGRRRIEFYAVSLDRNEDLEQLKARIQSQKLASMIHVFSGNDSQDEAFLSLRGGHLPYAVFIDERGTVRFVGIGVAGLQDYIEDNYGA